MEIDLVNLEKQELYLDNDFKIDTSIYQNKDIIDLKNLHVKGSLKLNSIENLCLNLNLTGIMVLKDSVTLNLIDYPLDIKIEEEYPLNKEFLDYYCKKDENILDIIKILWENIVLEVPIRLTTTNNTNLKGDGWSLGGEEIKEIDPRLEKLKELLDEREE